MSATLCDGCFRSQTECARNSGGLFTCDMLGGPVIADSGGAAPGGGAIGVSFAVAGAALLAALSPARNPPPLSDFRAGALIVMVCPSFKLRSCSL